MNEFSEFWHCPECGVENHHLDPDCQFCEWHEHRTKWADLNQTDLDGPQKCCVCGEMYGP